MYTPLFQELMCGSHSEFWATICGALIRDAKCSECVVEAVNKALGSPLHSFDDGPVGVAVHNNEVVHSPCSEKSRHIWTGRDMLLR